MASDRDTAAQAAAGRSDRLEQRVRAFIYDSLFAGGAIPRVAEIAAGLALAPEGIAAALQRLTRHHLIVLRPEDGEILMALPFSAIPTPFEVEAGGHRYWANCAWDALGALVMLNSDGRVLTTCGDCGAPLTLNVASGAIAGSGVVARFGVPAREWWDNLVYT